MKKFFAMAFAALAIVSCSRSIDNENPGGEEISSPTYATFKFNIASGTRAAADFDPATGTVAQETEDLKIGRLQLLIFNASSRALEFNEVVTGAASKTVLLTAGRKKIFFIANSDKLTAYTAAIDPAIFKPSEAKTTLTEFYALQFDAGTPQKGGESGSRSFDFSPLYTVVSASSGLPMSNTNEIIYTLKAGVTDAQAANGTPEAAGTSESNSFSIQLYYMTAKANLKLASGVLNSNTSNGKPIIKDVFFSIRNLARKTNYIQNVPTAGNPQSAYFSFDGGLQSDFDKEFDYASNLNVSATATESEYLYVPENNRTNVLRGQASYFAIKATYEPTVKTAVEHDISTKVKYTEAAVSGPKNYIYTIRDLHGIPAGTYYSTVDVFAQDAWIRLNDKAYTSANKPAADAIISSEITTRGSLYESFTNATSYYRVDIGAGSGSTTQHGVLRSNKYNAIINKITGPGVPKAEDLTLTPGDPVSAKTYIHATILPASWKAIPQSADL